MEFWGLEVKPGTTARCEPGDDYILHLSQAALGESKKPSDNALMYAKVDSQKLAIGTLSADKYPQIQFDLVFEKEFELSHTSKAASVCFSGYKVYQPAEGDEMDSEEDEDEEEELNIPAIKENGKAEGKEKEQKIQGKAASAAASKSNAAAKDVEKKRTVKDDSDEDETDDSDEDDGLSPEEGDDDGLSDEDDSTDDEEESDEDDEKETPKKPVAGKKRAAENASKTPASDKKAKVATPSDQKTGGKKVAHVATPHPAKQASKTPANNDKSKEKSPRSVGSIPCKSCNKTFNSEMALEAHSKAKH